MQILLINIQTTFFREFETNSMMKIHVFFSTLSTTVIEEEQAYTVSNQNQQTQDYKSLKTVNYATELGCKQYRGIER